RSARALAGGTPHCRRRRRRRRSRQRGASRHGGRRSRPAVGGVRSGISSTARSRREAMSYTLLVLRRAENDVEQIYRWIAKRSLAGALAWREAYIRAIM